METWTGRGYRRPLLPPTSQRTSIQAAFRTDEIRRAPPTPQDEMRAGMSYFHETIWKGVPKFLRRVDTALNNIGINERVPYNAPLIQFSSWMGGDRDGNPRVTPEVTRDVCLLATTMAANLYYAQIEDMMFELSMWRCSEELRLKADQLHRSSKKDTTKHYIEFWKQVPPSEPYRVILSDVRDKLYNTRERSRHLLTSGFSEIPDEAIFTDVEQDIYFPSLHSCRHQAEYGMGSPQRSIDAARVWVALWVLRTVFSFLGYLYHVRRATIGGSDCRQINDGQSSGGAGVR